MVQTQTVPWRKSAKTSPNVGRKWSDTVKPAAVSDVISKEALLIGCAVSRRNDATPWPQRYDLRGVSSEIVSPLVRPSPPPGLERIQLEEAEEVALPEKTPVEVPVAEPEVFQTLLQGLPEAMSNERMLRAMLEQAKLADVVQLAFRANGKALITFSTYPSVCQCISHFHGRQWGNSKVPVTATYVKLMPKSEKSVVKAVPKPEAPMKRMSAEAAVFVPNFCAPTAFSVSAPSFIPSADKICDGRRNSRDRVYSDASTEAGPMSDGVDSDMEEQVACT